MMKETTAAKDTAATASNDRRELTADQLDNVSAGQAFSSDPAVRWNRYFNWLFHLA